MPKVYDAGQAEGRWYEFWESRGFFGAEVDPARKPFCIVIPPPNVTGSLHMGHALDNTLQDILVRWKRMQGYAALWVPGTDHAGIATQIKVEEQLALQGLSRHDLGREEFLERVWDWKRRYGQTIINQLKKLGASCDWRRERFTMDEGCSRAVREVFVRLYRKGLVYRGDYMINWCPRCHTALSDIEVEHEEIEGKLYFIRYPLAGADSGAGAGAGGSITVATTRPETMLGDTAVALHPDDDRAFGLVGETLILPLLGRQIPVVADLAVDPGFGTGMVKVTPFHDPADFEMGQRHKLPFVKVIGEDGRMTEAAGAYAGLERFEARKAVLRDIEAAGLLARVENHTHAVGHCHRCATVVEPLVSKQWFVRMQPLATPAAEAVRDGRIRFVPERFVKNYLHWVENVRDWCISRQLWWGHRIPVWYCRECDEVIAATEDPAGCTRCGSERLEQDPDVLDTWFSSALWPFSTLGWPEDTAEVSYFYPTSVLVTAFDIIYFWVARMIFMGLEVMEEPPFKDVFIHGLVRDALGRKMSKSLGTGVDPLDLISEFGADALRFTLVVGTSPGNDMRWHPEKVEASRNFANKLWNAARFVLSNQDGAPLQSLDRSRMGMPDRWILSRLNTVIGEATRHLERYDAGEYARELYDFLWSEFCDWFIEMAKPRLFGEQGEESRRQAQAVLVRTLETSLRLLHPLMPFITEDIWQRLPHQGESIMKAPWPVQDETLSDRAAEESMALIMDVVRAIRNIRMEKKVAPGKRVPAVIHAPEARRPVLVENALFLTRLAGLSDLRIEDDAVAPPERSVAAASGEVGVFVPLAGLVDIEEERRRLTRELDGLAEKVHRAERKLQDPEFLAKAPAEVVGKLRETHQAALAAHKRIVTQLEEL
ncbi:MAG: valine--tRNA ligase [Firmicutes bacterium]|nr:valine--tRNA ligase [Bacillota bacterium]